MRTSIISSILPFLVLLFVSCVNGKVEKGTAVNPDSLGRPDSVSTLTESDLAVVKDSMKTAAYLPYFTAELSDDGDIEAHFRNMDNEEFSTLFSLEKCPKDKFNIKTIEGRCCGIKVMKEEGEPCLFMLMDDGHVERVTLRELSEGITKSTLRSTQTGIVRFVEKDESNAATDSLGVSGISLEGAQVPLTWTSVR